MAFNKKTWKDRLSEFATRRTLTDQDTGTVSVVEVARSEGTIYQQGDAFSAENMNDLEDRIEDAIENVTAVDGPMTDAAYDALTEAEKMDGTIRVVGSENEDDMMAAAVVSYDNTDSGLQADDVQGAIDKVNASLTENLDDISLRCNPTSSMPEWKKRGADTWNPFNSGYGIFTANFGVGTMNIKYFKQDGSIATASTTYGTSGTAYEDSEIKVDYASGYEGSTARYYITFSVDAKKAGYYMKTLDSSTPVSVESVAVGDTIKAYTAYYPQSGEGIAPIMFIYLGETNPFA